MWNLFQPVTFFIDSTPHDIRSSGITVGAILLHSGVQLFSGDEIVPEINSPVYSSTPIQIRKNHPITISLDGNSFPTYSTEDFPANILLKLGIRLFPGDHLRVDGIESLSTTRFSARSNHTIQVLRARRILVNGRNYLTSRESIGQIWWETDLRKSDVELQVPNLQAYLGAGEKLPMIQPAPLTLTQGQLTQSHLEPGDGINNQLAATGLAPQGLDQMTNLTSAGETASVQITRITDQLEMSPKSIPFSTQTGLDDQLELDQSEVTSAGEYGLSLQLTRIRSTDGIETNRNIESETILKHPKDEKIGYGTKINIQSLAVGNATIEYYRAISLYATSYSPCRSGGTKCSTGTASGAPARKGIVAVIPSWYAYMAGQQVYVPGYGYGIIGDTGGGIPGTNWIDLGYNDDDYVGWHSWVTAYFLTPVPANILYTLN